MHRSGFPIVVQVSCEPDGGVGDPAEPWRGFEAAMTTISAARRDAAETWGAPIVLSWMLRADLQIDEVWGDAGWGLNTYAAQIQNLIDSGDFVGLHSHPIQDRRGVEDYLDEQWTVDTLGAGIDAFDAHFGHPPACVSWGRGWTSDAVLAVLRERNVSVDMSVFPGRDQTLNAGKVEVLADIPDLSAVPRHPYYPSDSDWRVPADQPGDGTWILPFTTAATDAWMSPAQKTTTRLKWLATRRNGFRRRVEQTYFFNVTQPGFPAYADTIAATELPYLTLSIRASRLLTATRRDVDDCFAALRPLHERYGAVITDPVTATDGIARTATSGSGT